jgi:hypothetical protein
MRRQYNCGFQARGECPMNLAIDLPVKCVAVLALGAILVGCGQPTVKEQPDQEFATEGLHQVSSSGFERAYARPDAQLSKYETVDIKDMEVADVEITQTAVAGTVRANWLMTPERAQTLQQLWRTATDRAFSSYERSSEGDLVLRIESALTRITPGRSSGTTTTVGGQMVAGSADSVDVSAEFRLFDNASDTLLAVIRDRRTLPSLQWTRAAGVDMANQFGSWAGLLETRISGR